MSLPGSISLAGRTAVVTGGTRGIGKAISFELARRGASVAMVYANPDNTSAVNVTVNELKALGTDINSFAILADVKDRAAYERIVQETLKAFNTKTIDILVHNAGVSSTDLTPDTTHETFDGIIDTNLRASFFLTQAALPYIPSGGRIILISSISARSTHPTVKVPVYAASKAALESLTREWSFEFGHSRGITVNAVAPGLVMTEMISQMPAEILGQIVESSGTAAAAAPRIGTVDEIAQVVAFLASKGASWVTGATISASGGQSN